MYKIVFSAFFIANLLSPALAAPSHCSPQEETVFSCRIEKSKKVLSLCATADQDRVPGYLQYRFGNPGKIELQYPQSKAHSLSRFQWQSIPYSGGWDTRLQFHNAGYTYRIQDKAIKIDMQRKARSGGVSVFHKGKRIARLNCDSNSFGKNPYNHSLNSLYGRVPNGQFFSY